MPNQVHQISVGFQVLRTFPRPRGSFPGPGVCQGVRKRKSITSSAAMACGKRIRFPARGLAGNEWKRIGEAGAGTPEGANGCFPPGQPAACRPDNPRGAREQGRKRRRKLLSVTAVAQESGFWRLQGGLVVHPTWVLETEELAGLDHPLLTLVSPRFLADRDTRRPRRERGPGIRCRAGASGPGLSAPVAYASGSLRTAGSPVTRSSPGPPPAAPVRQWPSRAGGTSAPCR
jgi:hypothetical protein